MTLTVVKNRDKKNNRDPSSIMSENRRVVITGLGIASPIGCDVDSFWSALQKGQSGVEQIQRIAADNLTTQIGGEVHDFTGAIEDYGELDKSQKRSIKKNSKVMCREIEMGVAVAQKSLQHAGIGAGMLDPDRTGVIYGCDYIMTEPFEFQDAVANCMDEGKGFDYGQWGEQGIPQVNPLWLLKYLPNMPASHIAIYNDFRGANNSITLREASSNLAIAEAFCTIRRGAADAMVTGATGTRMHPIRSIHTAIQEPLATSEDPRTASRPFDSGRSGQVIAEGAGAVVLEEIEHARQRGGTILGEVAGYGSSAVVSKDREVDLEQAFVNSITTALRSAGMQPADVGHVSAHGLSSLTCDRAEARAIARIFDQEGRKVPVVAPKSYFGNIGAGGGTVELSASVLSLNHGKLFKTLNYDDPDPECPIHVVSQEGVDAGDSFISLSTSPFGQASAIVVKKFAA
ncbi:MAG: beta-ketoacyl-[acyl-carrier-protein] synthase family protein [Planctomycetota bacterium]|nr:beta-ketoacyl-[acyl-carrier-protein] synthase family protein [Planctomycetota bacterium]